jgi:hypothetical protein
LEAAAKQFLEAWWTFWASDWTIFDEMYGMYRLAPPKNEEIQHLFFLK